MPVFDPDGGAALVLARGFAVAFLLSVAGTLTFRVLVARRAYANMTCEMTAQIDWGLVRWIRVSVVLALLGLCDWVATVTWSLASPRSFGDWVTGAEAVLTGLSFGQVIILQAGLLVGTAFVLTRSPTEWRWRAALVLGTAAVIAEVAHGHAFAMAQTISLLEVCEGLHFWAAAAWLGGLVPLLMIVVLAPPEAAAAASRWFSPLGKVCVGLLAATALLQGWILIGSTKALFQTAYGWAAWMKVFLFAVLFGFAVLNRYWLAPALVGRTKEQARRRFIISLVLQTGCGLLIVLVAALLSQLRPGMDMGMAG